jgi:hypothetical protein
VALEALLALRGWSRVEQRLEYGSSIIVRCLERLPLRFTP